MNPFLIQLSYAVFVYDPNAHTRTWLRTAEALAAWQATARFHGVSDTINDNPTTRILIRDAALIGPAPPGI